MKRDLYLSEIERCFSVNPVCAILGPRQVGKTTLANMFIEKFFADGVSRFDLEDPVDLARFENPMLLLSNISEGLIVIDEIQRRPELFPILRVLIDKKERRQKFLILGSASRDLIRQSSETLTGRISYLELPPFTLSEAKDDSKLLTRGGFPLSFLASDDSKSFLWRQSYITTLLERDIPALGFNIPAQQMRRFWSMLAHYHGQIFNGSELSRSLGLSLHMVKKYLDVLAGTFMIRLLFPWFENLKKRQVKSPKIYFRDSGMLNVLLGIENYQQMITHPRLGALWEAFALEEIIREFKLTNEECFFWATQADAELDLFITKGSKRIGFEFKYADAPKITRSMRVALHDLKLDELFVIYPGDKSFPMDEKITARGLKQI